LYRYLAYDVCGTYAAKELFEQRIAEEDAKLEWPWEHLNLKPKYLADVHRFLCDASTQLKFVELNGIKVDLDYNRELASSYLVNLDTMEEAIREVVGENFEMPNMASWKPGKSKFNPRSPTQVKEYLYRQGIRVDSTDKDTLALIKERAAPQSELYVFLNAMLEHRKEAKLYGTYVKGIRERMYRGRVFPTFLLHGTTSGRLSCRNPNLQNIPRGSVIKRQFVPSKPENVFVQADYSQAELRVVTNLARDDYFRSIFNDPERDLFNELTPILYPDSAWMKDADPAGWKELRIRVKAYVYGLAYGRTEFSIAQEFGITEREAKEGMERFFDVIPQIMDFRRKVLKDIHDGKELVTPFGRHRRFYLITNENRKDVENQALSFLPQSTASDICLSAFIELRPRLKGRAYIRNLVHDSILAECHRDDAEDIGTIMQNVMVTKAYEVLGTWVTFKTDVEIGTNWSFKDAA
jgi:DNA polymerase-1